jgi:hypothetical protein
VTAPRPEASLNGAAAIAKALPIVERVAGGDARRVTGWATVDIDRAVLDAAAGAVIRSRDVSDDPLLGARCRLVSVGARERDVILLEPATEGRIAASLARFGEGLVALYLLVPPKRFADLTEELIRAGVVLSAQASGPFGRERLVAGGPAWGAHLLIGEDGPNPPASLPSQAATIEP